ncbi:hypothetical protein [Pararhizobium qamdonense]|uniref:hypothetical protein n=1 Tax=Pararhizobium qamdonense TaxID=3031126 RepID=UPI0023E349D4|nr:hypothetical protein [Pararhizobium qamdonense]
MRTDEQIVMETNDLARLLLSELVGTGYEAPEGHKFWKASDPRSQKAWNAAVKVMELVTKTEVEDALSNYLAEQDKPRRYKSPTGAQVIGVCEHVLVTAWVSGFKSDGTPQYAGDSKVHWDTQKPLADEDGETTYEDENGDSWNWNQLSPIEEITDGAE